MFGYGKNWHPIPNARMMVALMVESNDKYRELAKKLAEKSNLPQKKHDKFINIYGIFHYDYEQLLNTLKNNQGGEGVAFTVDSLEVRKKWKDYLINGRILIDYLGLQSRECLSLKNDISGLNKKKFKTLLDSLDNKEETYKELKKIEETILLFIDTRNQEKISSDTIVEFPCIDSEYGIIRDGKIKIENNFFNMIDFIEKSFHSIQKLTFLLLKISN
ncbi:MAG: hypothetical protein PHR47_01125 [Candidatus Pacebacteria bacterium]|nr:hypothetical protein [Candidatus Paceibacterota bacterium]